MKVALTVRERLALQALLPERGSYVTHKLVEQAKTDLAFTEEEIAEFGLQQAGPNIMWDVAKDRAVEFEIGPALLGVIQTALKHLDAEEALSEVQVPLWEKFVL